MLTFYRLDSRTRPNRLLPHRIQRLRSQCSTRPIRMYPASSALVLRHADILPQDFQVAMQAAFGNFVVHSNPSISNLEANGVSTGNSSSNPASAWPPYSFAAPNMMDLNTTCPDPIVPSGFGQAAGPACESGNNTIRLVNGWTWEGGRGARCDMWKSLGELVPE